jgi:uncharacterized integral membrane protein
VSYDPNVAINPDHPDLGDDSSTVTGARKKERDVPARLIVGVIALALAVVFVVQNRDEVETNFLFLHGSQPLWFLIIINLLLGALLGQAIGMLRRRSKKDDDD